MQLLKVYSSCSALIPQSKSNYPWMLRLYGEVTMHIVNVREIGEAGNVGEREREPLMVMDDFSAL